MAAATVKNEGAGLAVALLLIIVVMHYAGDPIASSYGDKAPAAAKAWDYVLRGLGGAAVLLLCGLLARRPLVWPFVLWGMVEDLERAGCRLAHPMTAPPPGSELFAGLCGDGPYRLGVIAAALAAARVAYLLAGENDDG